MNGEERPIYRFKSFRLDLAERQLFQDDLPVLLTPKAFDVLVLLVGRAGHLVEKDELMQSVWPDSIVEETNVTRIVHTLRKTLGEDDNGNKFIETVPTRGYRFIAEVRRVESTNAEGLVPLAKSTSWPDPNSAASPIFPRKVVGLAERRQEAEARRPEELNGDALKFELAPAKRVVTTRSRYLVILAALIIVGAVGLGYYFFYSAGPADAIDSVAVMPFVNATGDANTDYLSEGISDSIINRLSRLPNLKVNSLNSVLRYRGKEVDPQTVGAELKVKAVLMGRLTRQGDDMTISAELVDVRDDRRLWGGQYTRKLSEMLAFQSEIAREISDGLRPRLTSDEKKLLAKQHTDNNEAYLSYSAGKYFARQFTKEGFEKAIEEFETAIEIDPNYALAYTAIANTYQFMMSRGFLPPKEYGQRVELAALRALQIDDSLAEAHACLGSYRLINFDWPGAEKEIKRALDLDPESAYANSVYAHYLLGIGRVDESLDFIIRASDLDSAPNRGEVAFAYYMARRYDKAIEMYRNYVEKSPDNAHAQILLGEAYVAKGMTAEGVAAIEKGLTLDKTLAKTPERWDRYPLLAYAYAADSRRDDAQRILVDQQKLAQERYVSPYNFAIIYTALGDKDQAFENLAECVEHRVMIIYHLKTRPIFDSLRSDPRYVELLRTMNLTP